MDFEQVKNLAVDVLNEYLSDLWNVNKTEYDRVNFHMKKIIYRIKATDSLGRNALTMPREKINEKT